MGGGLVTDDPYNYGYYRYPQIRGQSPAYDPYMVSRRPSGYWMNGSSPAEASSLARKRKLDGAVGDLLATRGKNVREIPVVSGDADASLPVRVSSNGVTGVASSKRPAQSESLIALPKPRTPGRPPSTSSGVREDSQTSVVAPSASSIPVAFADGGKSIKSVECIGVPSKGLKKSRTPLGEDTAATLIQSIFRGYEVRRSDPLKHLRVIANVRSRLNGIQKELSDPSLIEKMRSDSLTKLRITEGIMALLLQLDSIQGVHPVVREIRKAVTKEVVNLQEKVDALIAGRALSLGSDQIIVERGMADLAIGIADRDIVMGDDVSGSRNPGKSEHGTGDNGPENPTSAESFTSVDENFSENDPGVNQMEDNVMNEPMDLLPVAGLEESIHVAPDGRRWGRMDADSEYIGHEERIPQEEVDPTTYISSRGSEDRLSTSISISKEVDGIQVDAEVCNLKEPSEVALATLSHDNFHILHQTEDLKKHQITEEGDTAEDCQSMEDEVERTEESKSMEYLSKCPDMEKDATVKAHRVLDEDEFEREKGVEKYGDEMAGKRPCEESASEQLSTENYEIVKMEGDTGKIYTDTEPEENGLQRRADATVIAQEIKTPTLSTMLAEKGSVRAKENLCNFLSDNIHIPRLRPSSPPSRTIGAEEMNCTDAPVWESESEGGNEVNMPSTLASARPEVANPPLIEPVNSSLTSDVDTKSLVLKLTDENMMLKSLVVEIMRWNQLQAVTMNDVNDRLRKLEEELTKKKKSGSKVQQCSNNRHGRSKRR